jgi:hypothetical protein
MQLVLAAEQLVPPYYLAWSTNWSKLFKKQIGANYLFF